MRVIVSLLLLAAGCRTTAPQQPGPKPPPAVVVEAATVEAPAPSAPEAVRGYGVIWTNAPLYSEPEPGAALGRLREDAPRSGDRSELRVVKVIAGVDDFVEVEIDGTEDVRHCMTALEVKGAKLRFFVRRVDFVPVTTRRVSEAFDDGTSYELLPGFALPATVRSGRSVTVKSETVAFRAAIPDDAIGTFFEPGRAFESAKANASVPANTELALGDGTSLTVLTDLEAAARGEKRAGALVEIADECARVVARTPTDLDSGAREFGMLGILNTLGEPDKLAQGSPIYWENGVQAGTADKPIELHPSDYELLTATTRRCYRHNQSQLRLCFDNENLIFGSHQAQLMGRGTLTGILGSSTGSSTGSQGTTKTPRIRMGGMSVSGPLPPEIVRRITRQSYARYRLCYEIGLRHDPTLAGEIEVRLEIDATGAVTSVANAGSTLPNSGVVNCVTSAHYALSFPAASASTTVTHRLRFTPG